MPLPDGYVDSRFSPGAYSVPVRESTTIAPTSGFCQILDPDYNPPVTTITYSVDGRPVNKGWSHETQEDDVYEEPWIETARMFAHNADYYRGLLDRVASHLGSEVYLCDDGSVSDEPLRAKIPELVERMAKNLASHRAEQSAKYTPSAAY